MIFNVIIVFIVNIILITQSIPQLSSLMPLRCYSCASDDYQELWPIDRVRPLLFSNICDRAERVRAIAPIVNCHNSCVTIFETQYVGGKYTAMHASFSMIIGLMMDNRPYAYVRACSSHLFAADISGNRIRLSHRPREIDFLLREQICLELPASEIWPTLVDSATSDIVQVCSCIDDRCNSVDTVSTSISSRHSRSLTSNVLILLLLRSIVCWFSQMTTRCSLMID